MEEYSTSGLTPQQIMAISYTFLITFVIVGIVIIIAGWKLYSKAGKPAWAAIIPVYNIIVWLKIIGKPLWWLIFFILPLAISLIAGQKIGQPAWIISFWLAIIADIVFSVWVTALMGKSFGQNSSFIWGLILLPFVFYPILGFGNSAYVGPAGLKLRKDKATIPPPHA